MKGRHTCQADWHVDQSASVPCTTQTSWPYSFNNSELEVRTCHLPHSYTVSGSREENLFAHVPQSIPTSLPRKSTNLLQPVEALNSHSLCVGTIFNYVRTLQITSMNKMQTTFSDMLVLIWPLPLPSMHKMLVIYLSPMPLQIICCIPSIWLALNRIISRHKYIQTIGNSNQLYSADFPVAKTFTHEQSSLWDLFPSLYNTTANCITFGANIVVMF